MKMHLQSTGALNLIRGYREGQITINDQVYDHSLVVMPDRILTEGYPGALEGLTPEHLTPLLALTPEVVLIGTGLQLTFPPTTLLRGLVDQGVGFEIMDTGAACRTFNILVGEGRRAAALLLVGTRA